MESDLLEGPLTLFSEIIQRGKEEKAGLRGGLAHVKSRISYLVSPRSPLADASRGSLCTGTVLCLQSRHRPHGSFRREGLALCPLVFTSEETETQRGSAHYSGSHSNGGGEGPWVVPL